MTGPRTAKGYGDMRLKGLQATILLVAVVLATMLATVAIASAAVIDPNAGVYEENCQGQCHGTIWGDTKMASEITFSHGYHAVYQCSTCHGTTFVHSRNGTVKPDMKLCWQCHGLFHGPQGEMATSKCTACHKTPRAQLRPASHVAGWAGKPHVVPGKTQLQTQCMMCHTRAQCETCHRAKGIDWQPSGPWTYNSQDGCLACHSLSTLVKVTGPTSSVAGIGANVQSFQVTGLEFSAHRNLTCGQCHPDFTYSRTQAIANAKAWAWNAGIACQNCHDHEKVAAVYIKSVHGVQQLKGNMSTALCSSCHGSHNIAPLKSPLAKAQLHMASDVVCGKAGCHLEQYTTYDDYYHGAAYKKGQIDSPSCWDCHGAHDIQPAKSPDSRVNAVQLGKTCGKCHKGSDAEFGKQAAALIHQKKTIYNDNLIVRAIGWIQSLFGGGATTTTPSTASSSGSIVTSPTIPIAN